MSDSFKFTTHTCNNYISPIEQHQKRNAREILQIRPAIVPLPAHPTPTITITINGWEVTRRADESPLQQFGVELRDTYPYPVPLGRLVHWGPVHLHGTHLLGDLKGRDLNGLGQRGNRVRQCGGGERAFL